MLYTISLYFLLFMLYSFIGWLMEVFVFLIQERKFINRGFFIGPYCPIYGVCSVLMILTFGRYVGTPIAMFVMACVLCTVIEYLTSVIMEKLFNTRWWDYSNVPFNVNGRVCLHNSVLFGLLGVALIYLVNPFFTWILDKWPHGLLIGFSMSLLLLFVIDNIISFNIISKVKETTTSIFKDSTEEITEKVMERVTEKAKEILRKGSFLQRRLLDAFPDYKAIWKKIKKK